MTDDIGRTQSPRPLNGGGGEVFLFGEQRDQDEPGADENYFTAVLGCSRLWTR